LIQNAQAKLESKDLDLIVANDIIGKDAGFGTETNRVILLSRDGSIEELPLLPKADVARTVLERASAILAQRH
jgi:phosphopantothenoylcysteine decarboxylase/phosphopantothenate--cysteine ligase